MSNFTPQPDDLRKRASLFWPRELLTEQESVSVIPRLVATQDKFISILDVSDKSPDSWKNVLDETNGLPPNLFLKHLMVLSDLGGEPFKRLRRELPRIFPDGKMIFSWQRTSHTYRFKQITDGGRLDSTSLPILQALNIVRDTAGNAVIATAVTQVHDAIKEGERIVQPLEACRVFPPMVISMVDIGEETGALPEMLMKVADVYDEEVDNAVGAITSLLEPIMIVFLAVVVGTIVIAMFLPLITIMTTIGQ